MSKNKFQTGQTAPHERHSLPDALPAVNENTDDTTNVQRQYEQLLLQYRQLQQEYQLLANSKAGRLTLSYWKFKDRTKGHVRGIWNRCGAFLKKRKPLPTAKLPSVTVIIPTYKETPYLTEAVQSVLKQEYPSEKVGILLAVNGRGTDYFETLKRQYEDNSSIRIIHIEKRGVSAARNYALQMTDTECVCYLDDDDSMTPGYLRTLAERMYPDVTIVCGSLCDYDMVKEACHEDTYINRALSASGDGLHKSYLPLASLFSSLPAKLYRTDLVKKEFAPLDEQISSAEDVLFWAENYHAIRGNIYLCDLKQKEHYLRRLTAGSLSRPFSYEWRSYVTDRLEVIERLNHVLGRAKSAEENRFICSKIDAQKQLLRRYIAALPENEKCDAETIVEDALRRNPK